MALAGTEQLLRGWATHHGVEHIRASVPRSWDRWKNQLPISAQLRVRLDELYDPQRLNLRNRIMHGGLLELESKRAETVLLVANKLKLQRFPLVEVDDPFSSESIAAHCVQTLEALSQEIQGSGQGLTDADRRWESEIALTDEEVRWGNESVYCDFIHDVSVAEGLRKRLFSYLHHVMPVFAPCFQIGFEGWLEFPWLSRHFVQHLFLILAFEGIYRLTVHLLGIPILQCSVQGDGSFRTQYRMLDTRPTGLFSRSTLDRILSHLDAPARSIAERVLFLALKARNAASHGAIPPFTEVRWSGEGHILVKAVQVLEGAGLDHLTREAAYYLWRQRLQTGRHEEAPLADWITAKCQIEAALSM